MPFNVQQQLVELDGFLAALRVNGVPIGPADIDRLRRLFALEPRLDRNSLKTLLSALLVKTPAQRETFEALFADWCPDHNAEWPHTDAPEREVQTEQPHTPRPPQALPPFDTLTVLPQQPWRYRLRWLAAVLLVVLVGALLAWRRPRPVPPALHEPPSRTVPVPPTEDSADPDALPATPVDTVWLWQADVNTNAIHRRGASARWNVSSSALRRWPRREPPGGGIASSFLHLHQSRSPMWAMVGSLCHPRNGTTGPLSRRVTGDNSSGILSILSLTTRPAGCICRAPSRPRRKLAGMFICTLHPLCTTVRSGSGSTASSIAPRHAPWYSN